MWVIDANEGAPTIVSLYQYSTVMATCGEQQTRHRQVMIGHNESHGHVRDIARYIPRRVATISKSRRVFPPTRILQGSASRRCLIHGCLTRGPPTTSDLKGRCNWSEAGAHALSALYPRKGTSLLAVPVVEPQIIIVALEETHHIPACLRRCPGVSPLPCFFLAFPTSASPAWMPDKSPQHFGASNQNTMSLRFAPVLIPSKKGWRGVLVRAKKHTDRNNKNIFFR